MVKQALPTCGFAKYGKPQNVVDEPPVHCQYPHLDQLPPSLGEIKCAGERFLSSLYSSKEDIARVELSTREQSKCKLWHEVRSCRITASNFHAVVNRRPTTDPSSLLKKLLSYSAPAKTPAMQFGCREASIGEISRSHEVTWQSYNHSTVRILDLSLTPISGCLTGWSRN